MKLYKLENDKQLWYFTDTAKAARYIGTSQSYIDKRRKENQKCKGWSIEEVNGDEVLGKFINPVK